MKDIRIFYLKIFPRLVIKFSIYLNKSVFVMFLGLNFTFAKLAAIEKAALFAQVNKSFVTDILHVKIIIVIEKVALFSQVY